MAGYTHASHHHDVQCIDPSDASKHWSHLYAEAGLWRHHFGAIVVPNHAGIRQPIIAELHDSMYAGHPGMRRSFMLVKRVKRYFWWPELDGDCRAIFRGCAICQRDKASTRKTPGMLLHPAVADGKCQTSSMVFITTLPVTARGHNTILVVRDSFTKPPYTLSGFCGRPWDWG